MIRKLLDSFLFRYTICFIAFFALVFVGLFIEGKSFIWSIDGAEIGYPFFVYEGSWLRGIISTLLKTGTLSIPMWDSSIGLGNDVILVLGTNPFNLLSVFFSAENAEFGMTLIVVLEMYLAGLSFSFFACQHGKSSYSTLFGSMVYVFCGWMVAQAMIQHLFLVPMIVFPLMLVGTDWVFQKRTPVLFVVSVALMFVVYFYFAYMACIALFFYCIYCYIRNVPKKTLATFLSWVLRVLALGIVGLLISCAAALPVVMSVMGQSRIQIERIIPILYEVQYYPSFLVLFASLGQVGMDAWVGFGPIALLSCVFLFTQKGKIPLKVAFVATTAMMVIPYFGHVFNGFSYVTNRWAWIYAFCVSYVVADTIVPMLSASRPQRTVLAIASAVYVLVITLFPNTRTACAYACGGLMLLFVVFLFAKNEADTHQAGSMRRYKGIALVLLSVSMSLPAFFFITDAGSNWSSSQVDAGKAQAVQFDSPSKVMKSIDDDTMWRYDSYAVSRLRNNSLVTGLNSFDCYTPIYNNYVDAFLGDLNLSSFRYSHAIWSLDRRSYLEPVLGSKYFLTRKEKASSVPHGYRKEPILSKKEGGATYEVFESECQASTAYVFSDAISQDDYDVLDSVKKQQVLCQAVAVEGLESGESAMRSLKFTDSQIPYEISEKSKGVKQEGSDYRVTSDQGELILNCEAPAHSETYLLLKGFDYTGVPPTLKDGATLPETIDYLRAAFFWRNPNQVTIRVDASNGMSESMLMLTSRHHMYGAKDDVLVNLGSSDKPISEVKVTFGSAGLYTFSDVAIVSQPYDVLDSAIKRLEKMRATVTEGCNRFDVQVDSSNPGLLYLSVPWSAGWKATVDGAPVDIKRVNTAFMAVELDGAAHQVVFEYVSPWLIEGILLSLVGIALFLMISISYGVVRKLRKGKSPRHGQMRA